MGKQARAHGVKRGHLVRLPPSTSRNIPEPPLEVHQHSDTPAVHTSSSSSGPAYTRGSQKRALEIASSEQERETAIGKFRKQIYAETTVQSREAQLRLWDQLSRTAGFSQVQLSPERINCCSCDSQIRRIPVGFLVCQRCQASAHRGIFSVDGAADPNI